MNERLPFVELYAAVTAAIKHDDLKGYIQGTIIPKMDKRTGKLQPQAREEIVKKIFSVDPPKPGEAVEVIEAMGGSGGRMTTALALEIADVVYYTLQPKCPEFLNDPEPLVSSLGIDMKTAYAFCVLKYETRLLQGDSPDYREVEEKIMAEFLGTLPALIPLSD